MLCFGVLAGARGAGRLSPGSGQRLAGLWWSSVRVLASEKAQARGREGGRWGLPAEFEGELFGFIVLAGTAGLSGCHGRSLRGALTAAHVPYPKSWCFGSFLLWGGRGRGGVGG